MPKEIANKIKLKINPRKAPGFNLITGEVLKQLPRKGVVKLTHLINASRRFTEYLHGATSKKVPFFIVTAMKTSNLT
jgi:hypothetical protein